MNSSKAHHHLLPKLHLNETEILVSHLPTSLSYFAFDHHLTIDDPTTGSLKPHHLSNLHSYQSWIILHGLGMSLAWFVLLPLALVSLHPHRSTLSRWFRTGFLILNVVSIIFAHVYRLHTPDLYIGQKHSALGWSLTILAILVSIPELFELCKHFTNFGKKAMSSNSNTYAALPLLDLINRTKPFGHHQTNQDYESGIDPEQSFRHYQDDQLNPSTQIAPHLALDLILRLFKPALERLFVIMASVVCLSGLVTYTGTCRDTYINSCLAHFIKGGIFFWYGLLTWIRYLGAWSHCGWGWNQKPTRSGYVSPEMLECGLIFLYGVTNTWMERFGARKDEPYTIKQIQHISIAVMFWFGGLAGMMLEWQPIRALLFHHSNRTNTSGNPFPALCISLTGLVMSLHAQEYVFQVKVHMLWGSLLVLAGLLRWATYLLRSRLAPQAPLTEALASLCLCSGGILFILSVEEITFFAMRHGFDDVMAFLNVTVAAGCLLFVCSIGLMTLKRYIINNE